ncbi:MAG: VIT domain-containing protein, partial [Gemmatimonadaceae bacterium]
MRFSLIAAVLLAPAVLAAQGRLIPMCNIPADGPRGVIPCQAQIVRTRSDVRGELVGRVVRYTVSEEFVNQGGRLGEADYLFPLPPGAAFRDLKLSINGQMVSGETMDAQQARGIYEEIVRKLRDPALVEWMGSGLLRTRIFPIQPGERKRVVVSYEAVVPREGDALRVEYARGGRSAGRYVGLSEGGNDGRSVGGSDSFELAYAQSEALGAPYSPTNSVQTRDDGRMRVVRVLGDAANVTLLFPLRLGNRAAISVLTHATRGDSGFAMITVSPPDTHEAPSARDVTFVVDVSGSMSGRKMQQARAAGMQLLATLRPSDRFRLIDFSNDVRDFRDGFSDATAANIEAGRRYLAGLSAGGGTNIAAALDDALGNHEQDEPRSNGNRLNLVLFLTDGMPTVGVTDPNRIAALADNERGDARLFTFGLGADVNSALLERLAMDGRGTAQFVRPDEDVERMVGVVASRLTDPVATDLRVRVDGHDVALRDVVPAMPMDLFGGEDLVVMARFTGSGSARVTVEGKSRGHAVRWTSDATFADRSGSGSRDNGFIPRLWAAQRIGYLSAERRRNGPNPELDDEIRALGERYGIPTEFTSYLVQEPQAVAVDASVRRGQVGGVVGGTQAQALDVHGVVTTAMAAPAPASAAEARFEAAKMASAQRAANSTATLDSLSAAAGGGANGVRLVEGHTFTLRDGRWVDGRLTDSTRTVQVQAFSKSYFALIDRIPTLRGMVALGPRVVMAGRDVA